ncbi:MAG: ModD protein [Stellaceae bacterium]
MTASFPISEAEIDALIAEDMPYGDLTTHVLGIGRSPGRITFAARHAMVACGVEEAARIMVRLGATIEYAAASGTPLVVGDLLLAATGPAGALHGGWKISQTLMEWASGVASAVAAIRSAARSVSDDVQIACARKAPPNTRRLAVKAVIAGGGHMHRMGLSETILIFPEHLAFFDGEDGIERAIALARRNAPERRVVVEVADEATAARAARSGADVIQLEKFSPEAVARVAAMLPDRARGRPLLAAAGGVKAVNAAAYVAAGADILVTSAPYAAPPAEVQVRIRRLQSGESA